MKQAQLDALIDLMGDRMRPAMRLAMADVLIHGEQQKTAAERHGVTKGALCERVGLARKKLRLAYKAITGEDYSV